MIRIILKNMDKKNYGIYGFSMALFSSIIYIIASLISINGIINLGAGSENVRIVFAFYYVVIACTGLLFIFYALNFYIKSRMKDCHVLDEIIWKLEIIWNRFSRFWVFVLSASMMGLTVKIFSDRRVEWMSLLRILSMRCIAEICLKR